MKLTSDGEPMSLEEYFRDTVFEIVSPDQGQSDLRRIILSDYLKAETVAKSMIASGVLMSRRNNHQVEDNILEFVDRRRAALGLEIYDQVSYEAGDADRLWPGLYPSTQVH